jgi:3-oxocholest-4-en-26-oyl-CoA dehydrogenase beta subunit
MDFSFSEEQMAIRKLMAQISKAHGTPESLAAAEAQDWHHKGLWKDLAEAGVLGLILPEEQGGSGLGFMELCILLEEHGKGIAPIPLWPTLCLGGLSIVRFGTENQKAHFLPQVGTGERILTAALQEPNALPQGNLQTTAHKENGTWILKGEKTSVPAFHQAEFVVVPAQMDTNTTGLFMVDTKSPGLQAAKQTGTNKEPLHHLHIDRVEVPEDHLLSGEPADCGNLTWLMQRAQLGLCAITLGLADRALKMTARYVSERQQFDRPLATFQAVSQRTGDAYVDVESMRMTTWRAAWLLENQDRADKEVAVAKGTSCISGHRVLNAAQHLHGGMGFDRDYPLYRYFLTTKQLEFTLGSSPEHLHHLGELLADEI